MKPTTYDKFEWLFLILIIIFMILSVLVILIWVGQQLWAMELLKNQCIAECMEINKKAGEFLCVC